MQNPIVTDIPTGGYTGASWIDYNNDGNLDLFVNQDFLYKNLRQSNFETVSPSPISSGFAAYTVGNL